MSEIVKTSIDIKDDVASIQINLTNGPVTAYGTLMYAQEMCSRYFLTKEISKKRAEAEEHSKSKVILPQGVRI
jgi:hypothetical protein